MATQSLENKKKQNLKITRIFHSASLFSTSLLNRTKMVFKILKTSAQRDSDGMNCKFFYHHF